MFACYFKNTITTIHASITVQMLNKVNVQPPQTNYLFYSGTVATVQVRQVIMYYPNICIDLDPLSTVLLKICIGYWHNSIIINVSLRRGIVPGDFTHSQVNPLHKI